MAQKGTEEIYSKLAIKYGLHRNIIQMVCNHPFVFAARKIADPDDEKTLMFIYLGKIRLKRRYLGKKRIVYDELGKREDFNKKSKRSFYNSSVQTKLSKDRQAD